MKRWVVGIVLAVSLRIGAASAAPPAAPPDVPDAGDVVVHGYPPHCHMRPGDPQDDVDLTPAADHVQQQVIRIDPATGKLGLFPDDYPPTGPDAWQRDGTRMDQYIFRVPTDGSPLCIGSRNRLAPGFVQLRRDFAAKPYWGKVMRFTAYVATRHVARVSFWIASGFGKYEVGRKVKLGSDIPIAGHFPDPPIQGNHDWTPISYTIGPFPCGGVDISYGVTLEGGGDVWLYQPKFEEVPESEISPHLKHGKAFLDTDPRCRHERYGYQFTPR